MKVEHVAIFDEAQKRKAAEINSLTNTNSELKNTIKDLKSKNSIQKDKISSLKFELAQLKQENSTLKFDRDHLTKILEDSNNAIQSASVKEKNVDEIVKNYKKKYDESTLETLKLNQKIKMLENQINKYSNECANLVKERGQNYENLLNIKDENIMIEVDLSQFSKAVNGNKDMEIPSAALSFMEKELKKVRDNGKTIIIRYDFSKHFP